MKYSNYLNLNQKKDTYKLNQKTDKQMVNYC